MPSRSQLDSQSTPPSDEAGSGKERTPQPSGHVCPEQDWRAHTHPPRLGSTKQNDERQLSPQLRSTPCSCATGRGSPRYHPRWVPCLPHSGPISVLVAQSCLTLCVPMDCSPPGSSVHGILQARILEWGCRALLQGIFPTQRLNPGLPHCRKIIYHLSHQGSPPPIL